MMPQKDTERIERIAATTARHIVRASGEHAAPHDCPHNAKLETIEAMLDDHSARIERINETLADGRVEFANLRKDIERLTESINGLRSIFAWVGGAVGLGLLGTTGSALIWVVGKMGGGHS
jgi:ferric-dicitrate binding protein FerR (iron transport regulator)